MKKLMDLRAETKSSMLDGLIIEGILVLCIGIIIDQDPFEMGAAMYVDGEDGTIVWIDVDTLVEIGCPDEFCAIPFI